MNIRILFVLIPLLAVGCGGGDSSPVGPSSIQFTASSPSPPANSVTLQHNSHTTSQVVIEVKVTGVNNVFGASFDIVYSPSIVSFIGATEGSFLKAGGVGTQFLINSSTAGRLIIGDSRLSSGSGGVSGSGTLATITFLSVAKGTSGVSFENGRLGDPSGNAIPGVTFSGGTIVVQ